MNVSIWLARSLVIRRYEIGEAIIQERFTDAERLIRQYVLVARYARRAARHA